MQDLRILTRTARTNLISHFPLPVCSLFTGRCSSTTRAVGIGGGRHRHARVSAGRCKQGPRCRGSCKSSCVVRISRPTATVLLFLPFSTFSSFATPFPAGIHPRPLYVPFQHSFLLRRILCVRISHSQRHATLSSVRSLSIPQPLPLTLLPPSPQGGQSGGGKCWVCRKVERCLTAARRAQYATARSRRTSARAAWAGATPAEGFG